MDRIETEHGIFTANETTGQTAEEVYQEWLENKDNPQEKLSENEMIMLAIADLDMQREQDKTEIQLAVAELAETILGGM